MISLLRPRVNVKTTNIHGQPLVLPLGVESGRRWTPLRGVGVGVTADEEVGFDLTHFTVVETSIT